MIENIWAILCQNVIVDKRTNSVSYLNCVEEITVPQVPIQIPLLSLGTLWRKTTESNEVLKIRIKIQNPSNVQKTEEVPEAIMDKQRHRHNIIMDGITFKEEGEYNFIIESFSGKEWLLVRKVPLIVNLQKKT